MCNSILIIQKIFIYGRREEIVLNFYTHTKKISNGNKNEYKRKLQDDCSTHALTHTHVHILLLI